MKKIIYSLVIMIAAGSLFTSCIEQVEPLGIQDMRFAKAEYIRALKDLRAADAELVRAEAAHELARARYVDAMTADLNADTEYQKLLNEYQQLLNEARQDTNDFISQETANKIDSIKKRMELRELEHQKNMVAAQDSLANAQERLRVALRNIALSAQDLTKNEKDAVIAAVKAYKNAFEKTADQRIAVLKKQHELDSLKLYAQIGDTVYDKGSKAYIGQVEKYKKDIERNEAKQLVLAALLLAVPDSLDYEDVNAWQEQLEQLSADSAAVAYAQYQTKTEMASYYTNNIHDGVDYFNKVAEEWKKDNKRPTWTSTDSTRIADGVKTQADFPDRANMKDSIDTFKKFVFDSEKISQETYNKFAYLLTSYRKGNPLSGATPKNPIIKIVYNGTTPTNADSIYFASPISQKSGKNMKTFILGAKGNGEKSQKFKDTVANYGLWGAYDILERELVTAPGLDPAKDSADYHKLMDERDSIWTAHRQILIDGIAKYEPYTTALANYQSAVATNDANKKEMVDAIDNMMTQFERSLTGTNNEANFRYDDSLALFDAMVRFAKARTAYLNYKFNPETESHDRNYFRYASGTDSHGKVIVDSVLFTELDFAKLRANDYDKDADQTTLTNFVAGDGYRQYGLANIANQLFNSTIAGMLMPASTFTIPTAAQAITKDRALYNMYTYDPATKTLSYTEMPDVTKAKQAVYAAVASFVDVYNKFWNTSVGGVTYDPETKLPDHSSFDTNYDSYFAATTDEAKATALKNAETAVAAIMTLDPTCYTLATFKPYGNKKPIVTFTGGKIDKTDAMKAILTSVDPAADGARGNNTQWDAATFESRSKIFSWTDADHATDFWFYMKAAYDYYKSTNTEAIKDLETVKAWIDDVETQFTEDAKVGGGAARYATWKAEYDTAVAHKPAFDAWRAKLREFAGEGAYEMADIVEFTAPTEASSASKFESTNEVLIGNALEGPTPFGYYPGEWNKKLGGEQLVLAETLFPDYPEKFAEWYADIKDSQDEIKHYQILINSAKEAYTAAAKVAGENVGADNWDDLIKNYTAANEAYRKRITDKIEELQNQIETWTESLAKFEAGKPAREIAIAEKAKELAVETAKLQNYEEALAYAKANLDRILEYVKSLDSNFVIPSSPDMYPANTTIW